MVQGGALLVEEEERAAHATASPSAVQEGTSHSDRGSGQVHTGSAEVHGEA